MHRALLPIDHEEAAELETLTRRALLLLRTRGLTATALSPVRDVALDRRHTGSVEFEVQDESGTEFTVSAPIAEFETPLDLARELYREYRRSTRLAVCA